MPISVCHSRALIPPDTSDTTISVSALQPDVTGYHNRPTYTASNDSFSHESPRSPVVGDVRTTSRSHYPEDEIIVSPDLAGHHAPPSPGSNSSTVSQVPRGPISADGLDSIQTTLAGPIRVVKSHSRRQPPGHIPRPRNAFILYRSWYVRQGFLTDVESDHREISRIVGKLWKGMKEEEKAPWKDLAETEKQEHAQKYPNYKYSPNSRRAAASSPSGNVTARASVSRTRKVKLISSLAAQTSDAAGVLESSTRTLCLITGADEKDQLDNNSEVTTKLSSPVPKIRFPSFDRISPEPQSPLALAQVDTPSDTSAHNFLPFDPSFIPNERPPIIAAPGTLPALDSQPNDDPPWSLASCSAPLSDAAFAPESDTLFSLSQFDYYDEELLHMWALRPGFDGGEPLNSIMACDNSMDEFRIPDISTGNSDLYYPTSPAASQPLTASEPELSPFDRIVLEGTKAGHPGVTSFGTPLWSSLFQSSPASSLFHNADSVSDFSSDFSSGHCPATEDGRSTSTGITSVVSGEPLDQSHHDCGLFSEWCNPDSPAVADSDRSSHTPAGASSGAPSPSLSLAYPIPTRSQKPFSVAHPRWESHEDLDAYEHAVGGIKAELGGRRFFQS